MSYHDHERDALDQHRQRRRRLLACLGAGVAGAYVAPTLFSVGQAQAWHPHSHPSRSRPSWSRPSRSRPSRYDGAHRRHKQARHKHHHYYRDDRHRSHREYQRDRRRLRDYREDPVTIIEDIILGRPEQR